MIFRYKKLITVFLLVVVFGIVARPVFAADFFGMAESIVNAVNWVLGIVILVEFAVVYVIGQLLDFLLQPGNTPIIASVIVQTGWTAMRDFANMFFLLILLALALSYILFPSFNAKQALPKLLTVALLINFSLPIAGIFLDASNVFTNHFLSEATGGTGKLSDNIMKNLGAQKMADMKLATTGLMNQSSTGLEIENIILKNQIIQIPFLVVTIFILCAMAFMFLIRLAYIYILLILLPLALLAYTWPSTQGKFGQWQSKFFQWVFFPPIAMFFIYIAMETHGSILSLELTEKATGAVNEMGLFSGIFTQIYQYIILFMLLIGSLYAAQSMSITGAGAAMGMLKSAGRSIRGAAWRGTKRGTARIAEKYKAPEALGKAAEISGRFGILARPLTRAFGRAEAGIKAGAAKRFEMSSVEKAAAEKMSDQSLRGQMRSGGPKAHVYASILASRGKLTSKEAMDHIKDAETYGNKDAVKNFTRAAPQEATQRSVDAIDALVAKGDTAKINKLYGTTDPDKAKDIAHKRAWSSVGAGYVKDIPPEMLEGARGTDYLAGLIEHGNMSSEHLKAASREGNWAFIDAYQRLSSDQKGNRMLTWEANNPGHGLF